MLPSDSFVLLQKELEKRGLENLIYFAGKEAGKTWFEAMNKEYSLKGRDVILWGSNIVTLAGWGEAIIESRDDSTKTITFALNSSVVSELHGSSKSPVDHIFRGLLCGAMCVIYKDDLDAVEIKCKAIGDPVCKFLVKPSKEFDFSNELVKKQLAKID